MSIEPQKDESLSVKEFIRVFSRGWRWVVIGSLLGGIIGWVISLSLPPVYEAASLFDFSIDFARTGLLTDIEEDQAMEIAGDIIQSTKVLDLTIQSAKEQGIPLDNAIPTLGFTAERRFNQWLLKVRWKDPVIAAELSNIWAESAFTVFQESAKAAIKADSLQRHILSLETCLQNSTSGLPAQPLCQVSNRVELQKELKASGNDLMEWRTASNGFFPGMNFTFSQKANPPSNPIMRTRGSLTLAGSFAGLFLSLLISVIFSNRNE
jgi:uncharacterized protein involved in exopolysaccharide biosynthesis